MKDVRLTHLVSFFLLLICDLGWSQGTRLKVDLFQVHPTQLLVGRREVEWRKGEMRALLKKGPQALKNYLDEETGTVIKGPKNRLWLVDGHHHGKALAELKKEDARFEPFDFSANLEEDWSAFSTEKFETAMQQGARPRVFLRDALGQPIAFSRLPERLLDLENYPLRSVVWLLKKAGAIEKVDDFPFQEFVIAANLRPDIKVKSPEDDRAYLSATRAALERLEDADERDFPGLQDYKRSEIERMMRKVSETLSQH